MEHEVPVACLVSQLAKLISISKCYFHFDPLMWQRLISSQDMSWLKSGQEIVLMIAGWDGEVRWAMCGAVSVWCAHRSADSFGRAWGKVIWNGPHSVHRTLFWTPFSAWVRDNGPLCIPQICWLPWVDRLWHVLTNCFPDIHDGVNAECLLVTTFLTKSLPPSLFFVHLTVWLTDPLGL